MSRDDQDKGLTGKTEEPVAEQDLATPSDPPSAESASVDRRLFFKRLGRWSLVVASAVVGVETLRSSSARAAGEEGEGEGDAYCDIAPAEWSNASEPSWDNASWDNNAWDKYSKYSDYSDAWSKAWSDSWNLWAAWSDSW